LSTEINRIIALPEVRSKMAAIGVEVVSSTPASFAKTLQQDAAKYTKLIRELKITAE
jgi:tripartite-type tricarboxylate transporter receptor subunit TctC